MKKSFFLYGLLICLSLLLTGCTNPFDSMPNLTEEENDLIAEYAAGLLVKHDKNSSRLASMDAITAADEREATRRANLAALEESKKNQKDDTEENADGDEKKETKPDEAKVDTPFYGIASFCQQDNFQIEFSGYRICESYPDDGSADMVFAMDASEGNELLVLQFDVVNVTDEDQLLDMFNSGTRFKISINDGEMKSALSTLLLDDLSSYRDTIPAQSSVTLVLVREVTVDEAINISTISMSLKNASGNATTLLM